MMAGRALAEAVSLAASAFGLIWISRAVGPFYLGYYAVALVILQLGTTLLNLGLPSVGAQRIAHDQTAATRAWRTILLARFGFAVVLFISTQLVLTSTQLLPATLEGLLQGMMVAWLIVPLSSEWLLVGRGQIARLSAVRMVSAGVSAAAAILLIRTPGDVSLLPMVTVLPTIVATATSVILARRLHLIGAASGPAAPLRPYLADGWQFMKGELATFAYFSSDRLFLFIFATPAVLGLYEAAYKLIQPFYAIASVVTDTMFLRLAESLNTERFRSTFSRYVDVMCFATIPLGFALVAYGAFVVTVVYGASFAPAAAYLQLLGWVITFGFTSGVLVIPFIPWGRAKPYGDAVTAGALVSLMLNVLLIPPLGGYGAALATVAAKIAVTLIGLRLFRQIVRYPIVGDFGHYAAASLVALVLSVALANLLALREVVAIGLFGVAYIALVIYLRGWKVEVPILGTIIRGRHVR